MLSPATCLISQKLKPRLPISLYGKRFLALGEDRGDKQPSADSSADLPEPLFVSLFEFPVRPSQPTVPVLLSFTALTVRPTRPSP